MHLLWGGGHRPSPSVLHPKAISSYGYFLLRLRVELTSMLNSSLLVASPASKSNKRSDRGDSIEEIPDSVESSIATVLSSDSPDSSLTNNLLSSKVGTGISLSSQLSLNNNGVAKSVSQARWSATVHSVVHALGFVPLAGLRPAAFKGVVGGCLMVRYRGEESLPCFASLSTLSLPWIATWLGTLTQL